MSTVEHFFKHLFEMAPPSFRDSLCFIPKKENAQHILFVPGWVNLDEEDTGKYRVRNWSGPLQKTKSLAYWAWTSSDPSHLDNVDLPIFTPGKLSAYHKVWVATKDVSSIMDWLADLKVYQTAWSYLKKSTAYASLNEQDMELVECVGHILRCAKKIMLNTLLSMEVQISSEPFSSMLLASESRAKRERLSTLNIVRVSTPDDAKINYLKFLKAS